MKWFKHYHNASSSIKLQNLIDELGVEGYGRYWLFLELLCEKFDGENPEIQIHINETRSRLRLRYNGTVAGWLRELAGKGLCEFSTDDRVYKIKAPILLELQDRDFKFARKKRVQNADEATLRYKKENKNKNKNIESTVQFGKDSEQTGAISNFAFSDDLKTLLENISQKTQKRWVDLYESEWVGRELIKALEYLENNPKKKKRTARGLSAFLTGWLGRGWEWHLKRIPTGLSGQSAEPKSIREILNESGGF